MRILHYGMGPGQGGIETYLYHLALGSDPTEFHLDFLYSDGGREPFYAAQLRDRGSRFYGVTPRRNSPLANHRDLHRLFAEHHFDLLHMHVNTASYLSPARAALAAGVPVLVHSHNAGASRSTRTKLIHHINRSLFPWRKVARVAVSTPAGMWLFGRNLFEVIPNGIDAEHHTFDPQGRRRVRQELGIPENVTVLGHVGALLPAKNHAFLVAVFNEVQRRDPSAHLLLVGDGPLRQEIETLIRVSGQEKNIRLLGRRDDIPALLSAMDQFVFPSLHEGFGLAALEAQASGLPALVSTSIPPEVALSAACRRLPLGDVQAWAQALTELPAEIDRASGAAAVAAAGFSTTANTHRMMALWRASAHSAEDRQHER